MQEIQYYDLYIKGHESLFKQKPKINNDLPKENGIRISFGDTNSVTYKNTDTKEYLETKNSMGQEFIVKDTLDNFKWKISRDKKQLMGYEVRKATFSQHNDSVQYTAWFAPKLNFKTGPAESAGLPGLILEYSEKSIDKNGNEEEKVYRITEIDMNDKQKIKKPTNAEIISKDEFIQKMKEQSKAFREMYGSGVDTSD